MYILKVIATGFKWLFVYNFHQLNYCLLGRALPRALLCHFGSQLAIIHNLKALISFGQMWKNKELFLQVLICNK
jgi:hypothetical protein